MSSEPAEAIDLTYAALVFGAAIEAATDDPLASFQSMSDAQDAILANLGRGEILAGLANKAGKTTIGADVFVSLAQGRETLGGFALPSVPQPSRFVVASLDFTQQQLSVQPKYLEALGAWPHRAKWDGEVLRSLRVRYIGCTSDDPRDWSRITFITAKNLQSGVGFRGNGYHCDEPPPMWLLRELRKMGESGSLCIGLITATMIKRSQWQPLRPDYPPAYEGRWHNGFLRLRGPAFNPDDLDDTTTGNRSLTRADKESLLKLYANDPDREARIHGIEIDTEGSNPLREVLDEIQRQHDAARDGEITEWKVAREVATVRGKEQVVETVDVESWDEPRPGHVYRIIVDTSLGIADGQHDPAMVSVFDMTDNAQVERYQGFLGEYGCGVLAGGLSRKWNDAMVDVATTGGYGDTCLTGLSAVGCRTVVTRNILGKDGVIDRTDIGFKESEATRMASVGALIEAFKAARMGAPYLTIRSRADLAELIDLSFDEKNRTKRVPGVHHGEVLTVLGRWATLVRPHQRGPIIPPQSQRIPESIIDRMRRDAHLPPRQMVRAGKSARPQMRRPPGR